MFGFLKKKKTDDKDDGPNTPPASSSSASSSSSRGFRDDVSGPSRPSPQSMVGRPSPSSNPQAPHSHLGRSPAAASSSNGGGVASAGAASDDMGLFAGMNVAPTSTRKATSGSSGTAAHSSSPASAHSSAHASSERSSQSTSSNTGGPPQRNAGEDSSRVSASVLSNASSAVDSATVGARSSNGPKTVAPVLDDAVVFRPPSPVEGTSGETSERKQPARVATRRRKGGKIGAADGSGKTEDGTDSQAEALQSDPAPADVDQEISSDRKQPAPAVATSMSKTDNLAPANENSRKLDGAADEEDALRVDKVPVNADHKNPLDQKPIVSAAPASAPAIHAVEVPASTTTDSKSESVVLAQQVPQQESLQMKADIPTAAIPKHLLQAAEALNAALQRDLSKVRGTEDSIRNEMRCSSFLRRKAFCDLSELRRASASLQNELEEAAMSEDFDRANIVTERIGKCLESIAQTQFLLDGFESKFAEIEKATQETAEQRKKVFETYLDQMQSLLAEQEMIVEQNIYVPSEDILNLESEISEASLRIARRERHANLDLEDVRQRMASLQAKIDSSTADLQQQKTEVERRKQAVEEEIAALEVQLRLKRAEHSRLTKTHEETVTRISQMSSRFDRDKDQIIAEQKQLTDILRSFEKERADVAKKQAEVDSKALVFRERERKSREVFDRLAAQYAALETQASEAESLTEQSVEELKILSSIRDVENAAYRRIERLRESVSALEEDIQKSASSKLRIQNEISSMRQNMATAEVRLPELEKEKKLAVAARNFREAQRITNEIKQFQQLQVEGETMISALSDELLAENRKSEQLSNESVMASSLLQQEERTYDIERIRFLTEQLNLLGKEMSSGKKMSIQELDYVRQEMSVCETERKVLSSKHASDVANGMVLLPESSVESTEVDAEESTEHAGHVEDELSVGFHDMLGLSSDEDASAANAHSLGAESPGAEVSPSFDFLAPNVSADADTEMHEETDDDAEAGSTVEAMQTEEEDPAIIWNARLIEIEQVLMQHDADIVAASDNEDFERAAEIQADMDRLVLEKEDIMAKLASRS
eukprot:ANDGO_04186.mRNA.1 hypothetical protein